MENLGVQDLIFLGVLALVLIVPVILYLVTAQNTLQTISVQNRKMDPASVWLMLIPFFGYFWLFKIVEALAESTRTELTRYGLSQKDTMKTAGLGWGIFLIIGLLFGVFYILSYIAFIMHWVKLNEARKLIISMKEFSQQTDDSSIFLNK